MAVLTAQNITRDGVTPTFSPAAAAGDEFPFAGNNVVVFRNTSAAAITVTAVTPAKVENLDIADLAISIPANTDRYVNGLASRNFQNANRRVGVTYSAVDKTATITNKALTGNVATLTTSAAHSFKVGESVTVTGVDTVFNGTYTITAVGATTFSYARTNADVVSAASGGTATGPALLVAVLALT